MTLAFSIKSGQWTTEYSFEPTCYANTDGRMVAFKDVEGGAFWLHDEKEGERNKYYGEPYKSKLSVVSNENPSATKAYEAISLETSYSSWDIDVETLDQQGSVGDLYERENDQYAPIPKHSRVSGSNLVYIGTCSSDGFSENLEAGEIQLSSISGNMATGALVFKTLSGELNSIKDNGFAQIVNVGSALLGNEERNLFVKNFSESSRSISLNNDILESQVTITSGVPDEVQLFVSESNSGEAMKGDYLLIKMETQGASPSNFELYAINVDQHKVNLDHSLGQNN